MSTPTIDYDALAKQYGATSSQQQNVDYDALAKQNGAISSTSLTHEDRGILTKAWDVLTNPQKRQEFMQQLEPTATDDAGTKGAKAAGRLLTGAITTPYDVLKAPQNAQEQGIENNAAFVPGRVALASDRLFAQPAAAQLAKAKQDFNTPGVASKVSAGGHALAAAVPVLGPMAADIGERLPTDPIGATVQAAGLALTPEYARSARDMAAVPMKKLAPVMAAKATDLYQSALKPSTAKGAPDPTTLVQTGLDNQIPVSKGGLEKIGKLIDDLQQNVSDTIQSNPKATIDPNKVAARAGQTADVFRKQVNAGQDLSSIAASRQQFLREQGEKPGTPAQPTGLLDAYGKPVMKQAIPATPAPPMSAADAQAMKVGTYQQLRSKAYTDGLKAADVEAQKALARGIKEELEVQFPELHATNAAEGKLLDLEPAVIKALNREGNHQVLGIGTPIAAGAAKAVTGSTGAGAVIGTMKMVLDNPLVKSKIANALWMKSRNLTLGQATARVDAYAAALQAAGASSNAARDDQSIR